MLLQTCITLSSVELKMRYLAKCSRCSLPYNESGWGLEFL